MISCVTLWQLQWRHRAPWETMSVNNWLPFHTFTGRDAGFLYAGFIFVILQIENILVITDKHRIWPDKPFLYQCNPIWITNFIYMCIYYCNIRPPLLDQPNENDYFHQVPWIILWQINEDIEKNLSSRFCVILLTDRATDKQTQMKPNRLGRGNESSQATRPGAVVIILHSGSWQPPHKLTLKSEALSVVLMDLSRAVWPFHSSTVCSLSSNAFSGIFGGGWRKRKLLTRHVDVTRAMQTFL